MSKGILLIQLGSPRTASPDDVKDYLIEFLGDPLVVQPRPPFWNLLLRLLIAPRRAPKSAQLYQEMLNQAGSTEMPLVTHTRTFAHELSIALPNNYHVAHCFQYGSSPTPTEALRQLTRTGCTQIHAIPLYPQRAGATSEAALACIDKALRAWKRTAPKPTVYPHSAGFATQSFWLQSIVSTILRSIQTQALPPTDIVFSLHGYPVARIAAGDPYEADCRASIDALIALLRSSKDWPRDTQFHTAYQSHFGNSRWLGPSSGETLCALGEQGASVLVVCPAFTADNLETLIEVDRELRDAFFSAGGRAWQRVPCLNAQPDWIEGFAQWVQTLT